MSEKSEKNRIDTFKMLFDFLKHLTTLNSGSILILLALAEKFMKPPMKTELIFGAVLAFGASIASAMIAMVVLALHGDGKKPSENSSKLLSWGTVFSAFAFFSGMLLLLVKVEQIFG